MFIDNLDKLRSYWLNKTELSPLLLRHTVMIRNRTYKLSSCYWWPKFRIVLGIHRLNRAWFKNRGYSLHEPYRYVPSQRIGFLGRFGLKTVIHFAHFGLESGMVFEGTTGWVYKRIYHFSSKWVRKKWILRNLFCWCSNLSNDHGDINSQRPGLKTIVINDIF